MNLRVEPSPYKALLSILRAPGDFSLVGYYFPKLQ